MDADSGETTGFVNFDDEMDARLLAECTMARLERELGSEEACRIMRAIMRDILFSKFPDFREHPELLSFMEE